MKNPNHNYSELLSKAAPTTYPEAYEKCISSIFDRAYAILSANKEAYGKFKEKARKKRLFGLEKYGKDSFQSSFENTMSTPILEHIEDELIDIANYVAHLRFKTTLEGGMESNNPKAIAQVKLISAVGDLLYNFYDLKEK
jgi:hypothetical protein